MMVYVLNCSRNHFDDFRLGVPFPGEYHKVIDTDAQEFGGNGHNWVTEYHAEEVSAYHHRYSIQTKLLPLHGMLFKKDK
jgi:1,4-alpha-glucan branching enzyme